MTVGNMLLHLAYPWYGRISVLFFFSGNNHRGQADGFSLEILPKLKDIKSSKVRILKEYYNR